MLDDVYAELNYGNTVGEVKVYVTGSFFYEGITDDPNSIREYKMSSRIKFSNDGQVLLRRDTFTRAEQEPIMSVYDMDNEKIKVVEAEEDMEVTMLDKEKYMYKSLLFSPNLFLQYILKNASANSFIATDNGYHIIRHQNHHGDVYFLYINNQSYTVDRIEQPMYHPVLGDYYQTTTYSKYDIRDGYQVLSKMTVTRDSMEIYNLDIDYEEILPSKVNLTERLHKAKVGEWLYTFSLKKWNTRAVVADLGDCLVLLDPPPTLEAGYLLSDNLKKAFPNKEVKYCIVSHLHRQRMGGVRVFMEQGAIIVTTEGSMDFFKKTAYSKHLFSEDIRQKKLISPKLQFVNFNGYEVRSKSRVISLYLLNKSSFHTDEHLIAYIPSEKILVTSDIIKTTELKERPLTKEEKGLVSFVKSVKIDVKQVIQSWPLEKTPNVFDYEKVDPDSGNKLKNIFKK